MLVPLVVNPPVPVINDEMTKLAGVRRIASTAAYAKVVLVPAIPPFPVKLRIFPVVKVRVAEASVTEPLEPSIKEFIVFVVAAVLEVNFTFESVILKSLAYSPLNPPPLRSLNPLVSST